MSERAEMSIARTHPPNPKTDEMPSKGQCAEIQAVLALANLSIKTRREFYLVAVQEN